jgi:pyruvate dehydrogenase E1 component alpha subunit
MIFTRKRVHGKKERRFMKISQERLIGIYRTMARIRFFETKVGELFAANRLPGFVHLSIGQEGSAVGTCSALRPDDYITSTHRGHGHMIAKGADIKKMMAELFGKRDGYCKGKGGSMHIADFGIGVLGANGVVAGGFPIAVGAGLSAKLRGTDQVTVCFFGDGASNRGPFHEALNMAAIWKLPVIFMCENNQYASTTAASYSLSVADVSTRAAGYGIPGWTIPGNDVLKVLDTVTKAAKRARKGEGPTLIEAKTYRFRGHYEGDPQRYRTNEEVQKAMENDPLDRFKKYLSQKGFISARKEKALAKEVENEIEEAVSFAETSPFPEPEEALEDLFIQS